MFNILTQVSASVPTALADFGAGALDEIVTWLKTTGTSLALVALLICSIGWFITRSTSPAAAQKFTGGLAVCAIAVVLFFGSDTILGVLQSIAGSL